jgi:phage protein D
MQVKIDQAIPLITYPAPGKRVEQVEIHYTTEKGLQGVVVVDKDKSTGVPLAAALRAHAEELNKLIGTTLELK